MNSQEDRGIADIALSDVAIDWLVKLHSDDVSRDDQIAFEQWRSLSEAHELAALEAETIWHGVGLAGKEVRAKERKKITRRTVLGGGVVALGGLGLANYEDFNLQIIADHITGIGEQRTINLDDGSTVFLNADSAFSIDYLPEQRNITLLKGQANFAVAPDPQRPFIVAAEGGHTQAIGTVFDVGIREDEVVVTVIEGRVEVSTTKTSSHRVEAQMDEQVRYNSDNRLSMATSIDAATETAWRRGKLIFNNRPLKEVVFEIERYRRGKIIIVRKHMSLLEVTGVFDLSDPDTILQTIEETLPVRVTSLPFVTIIH